MFQRLKDEGLDFNLQPRGLSACGQPQVIDPFFHYVWSINLNRQLNPHLNLETYQRRTLTPRQITTLSEILNGSGNSECDPTTDSNSLTEFIPRTDNAGNSSITTEGTYVQSLFYLPASDRSIDMVTDECGFR